MAVVIISLSVVALMGALITSITSSGEEHSLVTLDTILKSYAETIKEQLQLQPLSMPAPPPSPQTFQNSCAASYSITLPTGFVLPVGFDAPQISSVAFWNPSSHVFDSAAACTTNEAAAVPDDTTIQQITVTDTAANNVSDQLSLVVIDPHYIATPVVVVTPSPAAPTLGQAVVFTATITVPTGDPPPTGAVTWSVTGPSGPLMCAPGPGPTTCGITASQAGPYSATANVAADANYKMSSGSLPSLTVAPATPTVTLTSVTSSPAGVETLTFTATVSGPAGGPDFTKQLNWSVSGPPGTTPGCGSGSTLLSGTTNPDTATCVVSPTVMGSMYTATAAYPVGDPNYTPASSAPDMAAG
jgi:hypothetical protein